MKTEGKQKEAKKNKNLGPKIWELHSPKRLLKRKTLERISKNLCQPPGRLFICQMSKDRLGGEVIQLLHPNKGCTVEKGPWRPGATPWSCVVVIVVVGCRCRYRCFCGCRCSFRRRIRRRRRRSSSSGNSISRSGCCCWWLLLQSQLLLLLLLLHVVAVAFAVAVGFVVAVAVVAVVVALKPESSAANALNKLKTPKNSLAQTSSNRTLHRRKDCDRASLCCYWGHIDHTVPHLGG